jgi:hypothetical protein
MGMQAVYPWEPLPKRRKGQHWSPAVVRQILRRVAEGESLRAVCRDPEMPEYELVKDWMRKRPEFRADVAAARTWCGRNLVAGGSSYCHGTAGEIVQRLAEGESLTSICRDPEMPTRAMVYRWAEKVEDFGAALRAARASQADVYADLGWEWTLGTTPHDAYASHVKLAHLRWYVGKLGPGLFGPVKAEPAKPAGPKRVIFRVRDYRVEMDEARGRQRTVDVEPDWKTGVLKRRDRGPWEPLLEDMRGMSCVIPWDGVEGMEPDPEA